MSWTQDLMVEEQDRELEEARRELGKLRVDRESMLQEERVQTWQEARRLCNAAASDTAALREVLHFLRTRARAEG